MTIGSFHLFNNPVFHVEVYDCVSDIPAGEWNRCVPDNALFLGYDYLEVTEASRLPALSFRYAIVHRNEVPVAALYFQLVNLSDTALGGVLNLEEYGGIASTISRKINDLLFKPGTGRRNYVLVCGNLLVSGEHGIAARNNQDFEMAVHAISQIKNLISGTLSTSDRLVAYLVKDFYPAFNELAFPVLKKEYFSLNTDPEMILEIKHQWHCFDDYLAELSSKYRVRAKKTISKIKELKISELTAREVEKNKNVLFDLNDQVMKKAPVKLSKPSALYFVNMKKQFGKHYRISAFYEGDRMIAFTSGFWNVRHYEAHYIGIDYAYNKSHNLYLNILFRYIEDAIISGAEKLYLGRTALEIKSTVGASPIALSSYIRFTNNILNTMVRSLSQHLGPKAWTLREPFRTQV